jgi:hypothetical protein
MQSNHFHKLYFSVLSAKRFPSKSSVHFCLPHLLKKKKISLSKQYQVICINRNTYSYAIYIYIYIYIYTYIYIYIYTYFKLLNREYVLHASFTCFSQIKKICFAVIQNNWQSYLLFCWPTRIPSSVAF